MPCSQQVQGLEVENETHILLGMAFIALDIVTYVPRRRRCWAVTAALQSKCLHGVDMSYGRALASALTCPWRRSRMQANAHQINGRVRTLTIV